MNFSQALIAVFMAIFLGARGGAYGSGLTSRSGGHENDSFQDRMEMYASWAEQTRTGRRLVAHSPDGQPIPIIPLSNGVSGSGSTSGSRSTSGSATVSAASQLQSTSAFGPGSASGDQLQSATSPMPGVGGLGGCNVLRYATGFANLTLYYNRTIRDTPNFGECCKRCQNDTNCKAWTRVAGGDPANFRNCYLKYDLDALDKSPEKNLHNHIGHRVDGNLYPELRYVNTDYPSTAAPLILESGTTMDVFPAEYYGCPYEPNAVTPCRAPSTCNFNGNGTFVPPVCIDPSP